MAVRKGAIAFLCFALLLLGGCSRASAGEYYTETDHVGQVEDTEGSGYDAIGNYYTLQTALQNMIGSAREQDIVRVSGYKGDLDEDLESIRQHFTTVYPLGVYAVQGIGFDKTRILSEMEINVTIQYRRTPEEIRSIVEILDDAEFERRMAEFFRSFGEKKVFSFTWFTDSDEQFMSRIMKSWATAGEYAVGLKDVSYTFYPAAAYRRIVEIEATYLESASELVLQAQAVRVRVDDIISQLSVGESEREKLYTLAEWMLANVQIDEEATRVVSETGGLQKKTSVYTAYGALIEQAAAQSGLVLAAEVLGKQMGMDCTAVIGNRGGEVYWWLAVRTESGWLHLDLQSKEGQMVDFGEENIFMPQYVFNEDEAAERFEWDKMLYSFD